MPNSPQTNITKAEEKLGGLGTFGGVFTPSILTILGVIMYLRLGWVVGNVGLLQTLLIVTLASSITFLTGLSISAIATDKVVRTGGAYYIISRALGIEAGGAIGIPLYMAQALSVSLYTMGFAESVAASFPGIDLLSTALITTLAVAVVALVSASFATKTQFIIMALIGLSLFSAMLGTSLPASEPQGFNTPAGGEPFWVVFAIFFPAVTGIMSGVSMSGDLKNPSKSIPLGTLAAIGTGYIIYMILPFIFAMRADTLSLTQNPMILTEISMWNIPILLGIWGATLSSAIGSIMGAPRVLQALARDGALPQTLHWLGKGTPDTDEPRVGTLVTLIVALLGVSLGDLNAIAPVLSMFFLTTYMVLNLSAAIEGLLNSPSYRPTFNTPWYLSLLGALGCVSVMLLINWLATVVALLIAGALYVWLETRELAVTWGDSRAGLWKTVIRTGIYRINKDLLQDDAKNWRPHVLVMTGAPTKRWNLVYLAKLFTHDKGFVTIATFLPPGTRDFEQQARLANTINDYLDKRSVEALVKVVVAENLREGAIYMTRMYGLGPLTPNTVMFGDTTDPQKRKELCKIVQEVHQENKNLLILRDHGLECFGKKKVIHLWWGGLQRNGGLMLVLAYLMTYDSEWKKATVILNLVVQDDSALENSRKRVRALMGDARLKIQPNIISAHGKPFKQILPETSKDADLVFIGMANPGSGFEEYYANLQELTRDLPSTILILAAPLFQISEVLD